MSKEMWKWLGCKLIGEITKTGAKLFVNDLRDRFQRGVVDAEFLENIAITLEEAARAVRQIYGGSGEKLMDSIRQKARVEVREVEGGDDEQEKED